MQPKRRECRDCGEQVLLVALNGRRMALDVSEIVPLGKCSRCHGTGLIAVHGAVASRLNVDNVDCPDCLGTGKNGDLPQAGMVCLNHYGEARYLLEGERPRSGDALHNLHVAVSCLQQPTQHEPEEPWQFELWAAA